MKNREVLTDRRDSGPSNRMMDTSRSACKQCAKCSQSVPSFMAEKHKERCIAAKVS